MDRYVEAATRENTRRSYQSALRHFEVEWGGLQRSRNGIRRRVFRIRRRPHLCARLRPLLAWGMQRDDTSEDPGETSATRDCTRAASCRDVGHRYIGRELTLHGFGDDESEIVRKAIRKPLTPVRRGIGMSKRGRHPDVAIAHLDRAARHIVRPEVECAAALQIEAGMVPVTGQDAILDSASLERKARVWATIVQAEDPPAVVDDEDWTMATLYNEQPLHPQLFKASHEHESVIRCVYAHTSRIRRSADIAGTL